MKPIGEQKPLVLILPWPLPSCWAAFTGAEVLEPHHIHLKAAIIDLLVVIILDKMVATATFH